MRPSKPLYPPPWWSDCAPCMPERECLCVGDQIVFTFVGYDSNGNPLFCLKRAHNPCDHKADFCKPKHPCY